MFDKIIVVCVGNICRSPIGERALQQLLPNKTVASAGVAVEKSHLTGKPADATSIEVAAEHGISLENHAARQLTPALCHEFDLILVMEQGHINAVTEIAPEARGKTMLLSQWLTKQDIPDPYRQSREAFDHAYKLIEASTQAWAKKLG